jgi:hypothetical protein
MGIRPCGHTRAHHSTTATISSSSTSADTSSLNDVDALEHHLTEERHETLD